MLQFKVLDFTALSDHCPIVCKIKGNPSITKLYKNEKKLTQIKPFIWDDEGKDKFRKAIYKEKDNLLKSISCTRSPNDTATILQDTLYNIANKTLKKKKSYKYDKVNHKKNYSKECDLLKKEFRKNRRHFKLNQNDDNARCKLLIAQRRYRRAINYYKNIKKEKDINKLKGLQRQNPKLFWQSIKTIINNKPNLPDINDNQWVDYFSNLFNQHDKYKDHQFEEYIKSSLNTLEQQTCVQTKLNYNILQDEVKTAIKELKPNKASGIDQISNDMIKSTEDILILPLCTLFNQILRTGMYPQTWNLSLISPIH